jgi:hypothetical protein
VFDIGEAAVIYRDYCGVKIREKRCPLCGGTFRAIELPYELEKYLHVNVDDRYFYKV